MKENKMAVNCENIYKTYMARTDIFKLKIKNKIGA